MALFEPELAAEFQTFWKAYPRKVGRLDAEKAYQKARRQWSAQQILDGIEAYKRRKPDYADYCHPSTFLNQGRWLDEDDEDGGPAMTLRQTPQPTNRARLNAYECPHDPPCDNPGRWACQRRTQIEKLKR